MYKFDFKSIIWRIKYWFKEVGLGIKNVFRKNSVKMIRNLCLVILGILFIIAIFYHLMGRFTVTVDATSQKKGLYLYNTKKFEEPRTRLFGDSLEANNINITDIPLNIDDIDGKHYGDNYLAYTFYARNDGQEILDYEYTLYIGDAAKNVESATWILLFKNGEFELFAKTREDGSLERQYSYDYYEIFEQAEDNEKHTYELSPIDEGLLTDAESERLGIHDLYGLYEFRASRFVNKEVITTGVIEDMEPGEYDKYTVVAWLEGEDPDCVDDILGGYIEMNMRFEVIDVKEEGEAND